MRSFYHSEICWLRRLRQKLVSSHSQSGQKLRLLPVCCQFTGHSVAWCVSLVAKRLIECAAGLPFLNH